VNHETQKNPFEQEVKVERGLSLSASDAERIPRKSSRIEPLNQAKAWSAEHRLGQLWFGFSNTPRRCSALQFMGRDGVRCRSSQRRADYAFYLAPNFRDVKFYVEAKKPHGDIATADNYFQTARYGWSGKTKIGILHDFEQFEIVDCRLEPHIDKALSRNIRKYHFSHYEDPEKFAEIYGCISREAAAGSN
jgi:hypothetical protein